MMESQRPHRSGSTSSELFICFTSRHSSSSASSMKISSKSILSPARTDKLREPTQLSLSSSLSRRLRSNGSMKGGQASPMFPTGNKKRGSTFETPEPSSPKVTCIGQVRVKTKKQGKKMRTRSKRRGELSFRKTEQTQEGIQQHHHQECLPHRNQRWVHIPLTICEALRAFGSEFNCFLPCRSSCTSANEREKGEKTRTSTSTSTSSSSSCGAIFARWLMAIQEDEEEKRTEIPLVVGEEKTEEKIEAADVMEIDEKGEVKEEIEEGEEERVSICVPPRNALLLMRCRSEPFRMSSFANSFWDSAAAKEDDHANENDDEDSEDDERQVGEAEEEEDEDDDDDNETDDDEEEENVEEVKDELGEKQAEEEMAAGALGEPPNLQENEDPEMRRNPLAATAEMEKGEENPEIVGGDSEKQNQHEEPHVEHTEEQILGIGFSAEALEELEKPEKEANDEEETSLGEIVEEAEVEEEMEMEEEARRTSSSSSSSSSVDVSVQPPLADGKGEGAEQLEVVVEREALGLTEAADAATSEETVEESKEEMADRAPQVHTEEEKQEEISPPPPPPQPQDQTHEEDQNEDGQGEGGGRAEAKSEEGEGRSKLPDCLLLMMCEPKLSMEVSKETWVCSTDFIRCRPAKQMVIPKDGEEESKKRVSTDSNPAQQQQPPQQQTQQQEARKSCSNSNPTPPPLPSMASMIEQKLVNAKAYEPFVLTRCKSEPMRTSAKLAPEACFWKNRRLEPHPPTTLGVGEAGLGF